MNLCPHLQKPPFPQIYLTRHQRVSRISKEIDYGTAIFICYGKVAIYYALNCLFRRNKFCAKKKRLGFLIT